ncbi:hypothetical protein QU24_03770 [Pantoea rodasii]|uniref:Uncharacterized protein n=1 Tax=Pantoea rodasii TaxID=1076549 RepID=A0A0B1REA2_9GAMM|nr:hypothetical protein QU24_03770 [Pantoea rodasii]
MPEPKRLNLNCATQEMQKHLHFWRLPVQMIGVIVTSLILRAGRNSPPAVNQLRLKARERFCFTVKGQQIRCNSGADG